MSTSSSLKELRDKYAVVRPDKFEVVSSGCLAIDWATGKGGIPRATVVDLFGDESLGKTTLVLSMIAERLRAGEPCAYVDVEHRLTPDLVEQIIPNKENFEVFYPKDGDAALAIAEKVMSLGFRFVAIDSLAAIVPAEMLDEEFNPNRTGLAAARKTQFLNRVRAKITENGIILLCVNQMRANMMQSGYGPTKVPTGGWAIKFAASLRMLMASDGPIREGDTLVGHKLKIAMVKNTFAHPGKVALLSLLYGVGIDQTRDLIEAGTATGVITQSAGWYTYEDEDHKAIRMHGADALIEALAPNMVKVQTRIREAMKPKPRVLEAEAKIKDVKEKKISANK